MSQIQFLQKCAAAMNGYRELTQDASYGSRVENGRMQLVRVTFDERGKSQIEECSEWMPVGEWLAFMDSIAV